jgi:chromosomal replication initiation ATPase DnaA
MSLVSNLASARRERLARLGTPHEMMVPKDKLFTAEDRIKELTKRVNELEKINTDLHGVISRQIELIRDFADEGEVPKPRINDIFHVIAKHFKITKSTLTGESRLRATVYPRHLAYYIARRAGYSYLRIGKAAGKDHTTVMHGSGVMARRSETDPDLVALVAELEFKIGVCMSERVSLAREALYK